MEISTVLTRLWFSAGCGHQGRWMNEQLLSVHLLGARPYCPWRIHWLFYWIFVATCETGSCYHLSSKKTRAHSGQGKGPKSHIKLATVMIPTKIDLLAACHESVLSPLRCVQYSAELDRAVPCPKAKA